VFARRQHVKYNLDGQSRMSGGPSGAKPRCQYSSAIMPVPPRTPWRAAMTTISVVGVGPVCSSGAYPTTAAAAASLGRPASQRARAASMATAGTRIGRPGRSAARWSIGRRSRGSALMVDACVRARGLLRAWDYGWIAPLPRCPPPLTGGRAHHGLALYHTDMWVTSSAMARVSCGAPVARRGGVVLVLVLGARWEAARAPTSSSTNPSSAHATSFISTSFPFIHSFPSLRCAAPLRSPSSSFPPSSLYLLKRSARRE
jgi:hypothetical protein